MRILIEVDGQSATLSSGAATGVGHVPGSVAAEAPADGGGAPGDGGLDVSGQQPEGDSGPPPQWLLDAVAEAEAAGLNPVIAEVRDEPGATMDAGAAPAD
jgi:hypothetical protein